MGRTNTLMAPALPLAGAIFIDKRPQSAGPALLWSRRPRPAQMSPTGRLNLRSRRPGRSG